ncbi:hypothetical protein DSO57_1026165 [Entomophthora muscae]|uniref:Uncharacterized protein n=1 Tax=Entomophthora muscae TaxID=34485 RepID=A0ACC2ULZ4_9FUNG|nr:hypothetical protein DSO57_1026165 [Entomophthora muscae]
MQAKYKLLTNPSPLLENDNSSKPVPGYGPGHTMGTGDQEPHSTPVVNHNIHALSFLPLAESHFECKILQFPFSTLNGFHPKLSEGLIYILTDDMSDP